MIGGDSSAPCPAPPPGAAGAAVPPAGLVVAPGAAGGVGVASGASGDERGSDGEGSAFCGEVGAAGGAGFASAGVSSAIASLRRGRPPRLAALRHRRPALPPPRTPWRERAARGRRRHRCRFPNRHVLQGDVTVQQEEVDVADLDLGVQRLRRLRDQHAPQDFRQRHAGGDDEGDGDEPPAPAVQARFPGAHDNRLPSRRRGNRASPTSPAKGHCAEKAGELALHLSRDALSLCPCLAFA